MSLTPYSSSLRDPNTPPSAIPPVSEGTATSSSMITAASPASSSSSFAVTTDDDFWSSSNNPWSSSSENPFGSPLRDTWESLSDLHFSDSPIPNEVDAPFLLDGLNADVLMAPGAIRALVSESHSCSEGPSAASSSRQESALSETHSVEVLPHQLPSEGFSYLSIAYYASKISGLGLLLYKGGEYLFPALVSRGICMSNIISPDFCMRFQRMMAPITSIPYRIYSYFFGSDPLPFIKHVFIAPVYEELEHRYVLQHLILNKIPRSILEKVAPNYADIMDKLPIQILRIFVASLLFTAAHAIECNVWGGLPQFFFGVLSGIFNEMNQGNLIDSINLHAFNNLLHYLM